MEITTLDLARILAAAARRATSDEDAAVAVLDAMHATSSWFCRRVETTDGLTRDFPYEPAQRTRLRPSTSTQPGLFDGGD